MSVVSAWLPSPVRDLRDLGRAWTRFWFEPQDVATVCWLRLLAGGMILYTHLIWGLRLELFFGSEGFQPADVVHGLREGVSFWSFWWFVPDELLWPAHLLALAILACFFVGFATPLTSKLTYLIVVSYAHRVPLANFGLDQINAFLALYLALAPCGRLYSVDAWLRRRREVREATSASRPVPPQQIERSQIERSQIERSSWARLSTRLIQLQLCVLYTYAGIAKLKGDAWWDGNAVWMALANQEYQSITLMWLAWARPVTELITHATILWECSFWALVWHPRLRPYVLIIGALMHLGIGGFLGMWTFGLVMTFAYQAFVSPELIRETANKLFGNGSLRISRTIQPDEPAPMPEPRRKLLERIIFVDSDAGVREQATRYFTEQGIETAAVADWSTAAELSSNHAVDALVVNASEMDAAEVRSIAASLSHPTVLLVDEASEAVAVSTATTLVGPQALSAVLETAREIVSATTENDTRTPHAAKTEATTHG